MSRELSDKIQRIDDENKAKAEAHAAKVSESTGYSEACISETSEHDIAEQLEETSEEINDVQKIEAEKWTPKIMPEHSRMRSSTQDSLGMRKDKIKLSHSGQTVKQALPAFRHKTRAKNIETRGSGFRKVCSTSNDSIAFAKSILIYLFVHRNVLFLILDGLITDAYLHKLN